MTQGIHRVGEIIEVTYQATKSTSGLTDVTMEIYDETHVKDGINFPDVTMTEIGSTGRYYGSFTPDVEGVWNVMIDSVTKSGKTVKQYAVTGYNVDAVGDAVAVVDSTMAKDATVAKTGADGDTLETLSDQLDAVEGPPMIG